MGTSFQLSEVAHLVVKEDGAEWICQGVESGFSGHVFQLDRWHLLDRIEKFAGHLPRVWKRLRSWVYQDRVGSLARSLRLIEGADARSEQARQELLSYVTPARRSHHGRRSSAPPREPRSSPVAHPRDRSRGENHRRGDRAPLQTLGHALDPTRCPGPAEIATLDCPSWRKMVRSLELNRTPTDKCLTQPIANCGLTPQSFSASIHGLRSPQSLVSRRSRDGQSPANKNTRHANPRS